MKYKALFADIDGTLLNSCHRMTKASADALKECMAREMLVCLSSSRSPQGIYPIQQEHSFSSYIIAFGGGIILSPSHQILFEKGMTREKASQVISFLEDRKFDLTWNLFTSGKWIVSDCLDPRVKKEEAIVRTCSMQGSPMDMEKEEQADKILCMCSPLKINEIENAVIKQFPDLSVAKSSEILLEIMEHGVDKAEAVKWLCRHKKIKREEVIAIGDNYNDVEMLEEAGYPILMGNAPEELKTHFSHITDDNDHDGAARALHQLIN